MFTSHESPQPEALIFIREETSCYLYCAITPEVCEIQENKKHFPRQNIYTQGKRICKFTGNCKQM